jgi:hypothetical protein
MELSEHERRLLREMETHLLAEDPSLASSLSVHRLRLRASAVLAGSGLAVGLVLMAVGVWRAHLLGILIAMVGYLTLVVSTHAVGESLRARRNRQRRTSGVGSDGTGDRPSKRP